MHIQATNRAIQIVAWLLPDVAAGTPEKRQPVQHTNQRRAGHNNNTEREKSA
jgi:hypothetical protein